MTYHGYRAAFVVRACQVHTLLATCFLETPSRHSALRELDDKPTVSMGFRRECHRDQDLAMRLAGRGGGAIRAVMGSSCLEVAR